MQFQIRRDGEKKLREAAAAAEVAASLLNGEIKTETNGSAIKENGHHAVSNGTQSNGTNGTAKTNGSVKTNGTTSNGTSTISNGYAKTNGNGKVGDEYYLRSSKDIDATTDLTHRKVQK